MAGEAGALGRAFVEIVVPRAQFESQMAGVGTSFASHTSRMISEGQAAAAAIAAANTGLVTSYNMVTGAVMGLLSAQQMATLSSNNLALAMHQGAVATQLMAVGAVDLSVGVAAVGTATMATGLTIGSMLTMMKAVLPYMAAFAAITKTLSMASGATDAQREYNKELYQLWTLTDLNQQGIDALGDEIRNLAYDYNVFAAHGAKAMYQIYSATFFAADATEIFESGMRAAAAGVTDITTAVDMMTTVLNAYNMSATESEHVNDLLFTAVRYGKTTYSELAAQFGRLAGVAAPAGARLEEMTAAIATLTRQGIATDWAVTSLRQTIMQMFRPTGHLADLIRDLGYDTGRSMIQANGFAGALKLVSEGAEKGGIPLENLFTNVRAITAVLPLVTTAAAGFALDLERTGAAAGTMDVAFQKVAQSWEYRIETLKSQINDVAISVGEVLMPAIESFLKSWTGLSEGFEIIVDLLGPAGEAFADIAGYMAGGAVAAGALAAGIWAINAALVAINAHPVVAAISATLMLLGTGIGFLVSKLKDMQDATEDNVDALKKYLDEVKKLRPIEEEIPTGLPLPPSMIPVPSMGEGTTAWGGIVKQPLVFMVQARVTEIMAGLTNQMLTAMKEGIPEIGAAAKAGLEQFGVSIIDLEQRTFDLARSTTELRILQKELADESDEVAKTVAEAFGYTLAQIRLFREEVKGETKEAPPLTQPGTWDWVSEMFGKVAVEAAKLDPANVEGTMEAVAKLQDYLGDSKDVLEVFTNKGWAGTKMVQALVDRINALLGESSLPALIRQFNELHLAFTETTTGSIAQAESLQGLQSLYQTAIGLQQALASIGIKADDQLLKLIADLEDFGLAAAKVDVTGITTDALTQVVGAFAGDLGSELAAVIGAISPYIRAGFGGAAAGPEALSPLIGSGVGLAIGAISWIMDKWAEDEAAAAAAQKATEDELIEASQALAGAFWDLVQSAESVASIQEGLAQLQVDIMSTILGFLWPLADILTSITDLFIIQEETIKKEVEARQKLLSNLNVPIGWPINRTRFGAATPGEAVQFDWSTATPEEEEPSEVLTWWQEAMEPFRDEIILAIQPIANFRDTVQAAYEAIFPSIIEGILPVLDTFGWTLDQLSKWIEDVFVDDLKAFAEGFGTFWTDMVDPFWKEDMAPQVGEWLDRIYGWLDAIIGFFSTEGWEWLSTDVWGAIQPFVDTVLDMFEEFGAWVNENWDDIKDNLLERLQGVLNDIVTNLGTVLGNIKAWLLGEDLEGETSNWEWLIGAINTGLEFINAAVNSFRSILETVGGVFTFFVNVLGGIMNLFIGAGNAFIAAINWALGWLGVHIDELPYFEAMGKGGIAMDPTLSLIGEQGPEVVLPLDRLAGLLSTQPMVSAAGLGGINPFSPSAQYAAAGAGGHGATININLSQQRLTTIMLKELTSKNVNDAGVGFAPIRM